MRSPSRELDVRTFDAALLTGPFPRENTKKPPTGIQPVGGSKETTLVDPRGFEPLTPCMPCRCATGLRHGPMFFDLSIKQPD